MVAHAAVALRRRCGAPLTATIHATEAGRNRGWVTTELSTSIHGIEWWLANTSDAVITCSRTMRDEVRTLFGVGSAHVVPNGIEPADWQRPEFETARISAENADAHPLIAYTGRVEWEKGVQTLVSAMPALRQAHPGIRLLVAGRGSYLDDVQRQAARPRASTASVRFLGWVSEEDLRAIVAAADLAVAPSLYEPFGLVALEAAAIGTPLVVSRDRRAGGVRRRRPARADLHARATPTASSRPSPRPWPIRGPPTSAPNAPGRPSSPTTTGATSPSRPPRSTRSPRRPWAPAPTTRATRWPTPGDALRPPHFDAPPGRLLDVPQ